MPNGIHPLLTLPSPSKVTTRERRPPRFIGPNQPGKARQVRRLSPQFEELRRALEERRAAIQADATGVAPEQILVFETNGPVAEFVQAVLGTKGLDWLNESELEDIEPDEDFFHKDDKDAPVSARVYMIMTNQAALQQLLSLWARWSSNDKIEKAFRPWQSVFARLRDIRRWGPEDRIFETGLQQNWEFQKTYGPSQISVEIELWFRKEDQRDAAAARVKTLVQEAGGRVVSSAVIGGIAYHALLASLPPTSVEALLNDRSIKLIQADDIQLFRPVPQGVEVPGQECLDRDVGDIWQTVEMLPPTVALLDGLPLENHKLLQNRLIVDDPDEWAPTYQSGYRHHGTAMASLIQHGDLSAAETPSKHRLYVRPILKPDAQGRESAPNDVLWVDLIYRAVRRIVESEGDQAAVAPTVKIINLSVGNRFQPFFQIMTPLARLVDWLAWKYGVLFVVSAGNYPGNIEVGQIDPETIDAEIAQSLQANHRLRRIISPAESINALTIGALHHDASGPWTPKNEEMVVMCAPGSPAPYSAVGRGFRRAIKPDLFAPGGRAVYARKLGTGNQAVLEQRLRAKLPPGIKHASPGREQGDLGATSFSIGTSNANALVARAGERVLDIVYELRNDDAASHLRALPEALLVKVLLMHTADWTPDALETYTRAIRTQENRHIFRDHVGAFLGYGALRSDRAIACTEERATVVGGGLIADKETWIHRVPLPPCLNAQVAWRRLTVTLAWFAPTDGRSRKYRMASLKFDPPRGEKTPLRVAAVQASHHAVVRGTVQHVILEREKGAMNVSNADVVEIPVTCTVESGDQAAVLRIPYTIAVSLEVAPGLKLPIYDELRARLRSQVRV